MEMKYRLKKDIEIMPGEHDAGETVPKGEVRDEIDIIHSYPELRILFNNHFDEYFELVQKEIN